MLFTKPARPGRVKTRLIGELTAGQAAQLHAAFQSDLVARLRGGGFELWAAWALDEEETVPTEPVPGFRQRGADLGARLFAGLRRAAREHELVAAVGSDHPDLPLANVEEAFGRLAAGADVVLGPAEDGGYYLIAVRAEALREELFGGVEWSTSRVLQATLANCRRLGLGFELLSEAPDVDTPDDLERLAATLAAGAADCPRTANLLQNWGRLP